jgi:sugar transferase (PEP-CTERM/EpsH1 system associated)
MADILFLAHRIPYPPNKGDKIRSWHILEHLARRHRVHLGCFVDDPQDMEHVPFLKSVAAETLIMPVSPFWGKLGSLRGLLTGEPLSVAFYANHKFRDWVGHILASQPISAVFLYSSAMGQFVPEGLAKAMPVIMDFVDVDSDKWAQYAVTSTWPMRWVYARESRTLIAYERKIARMATAGLFVSGHEAELFKSLAPDVANKIFPLSNGVDYQYFSPDQAFPSPYSSPGAKLVFTGAMDYWANGDAVKWFAEDILPKIRIERPEVEFFIVGGKPSREVSALAALPGVTVTGRVADVRPYILHGDVVVCPLRIARGIQNKVLEGMAMGRPVVATSAAFEGIDAEPGREISIADDPQDFAGKVLALLDGKAALKMGKLARARIVKSYGWEGNLAALDQLMLKK